MVERVVHLGFEVRVELVLEDGRECWAQVTRDEAEPLELAPGSRVFVRPRRTRVFSAGEGEEGQARCVSSRVPIDGSQSRRQVVRESAPCSRLHEPVVEGLILGDPSESRRGSRARRRERERS